MCTFDPPIRHSSLLALYSHISPTKRHYCFRTKFPYNSNSAADRHRLERLFHSLMQLIFSEKFYNFKLCFFFKRNWFTRKNLPQLSSSSSESQSLCPLQRAVFGMHFFSFDTLQRYSSDLQLAVEMDQSQCVNAMKG